MMNLSRRIVLVAMMFVLAIGGAWAQPGGGGGRGPGHGEGEGEGGGKGFERQPNPGMMLDHCVATLDLSQEQKDQIKAIRTRLENAAADTREQMMALERRMHAAREAGDRDAAAAIAAEMKALHDQLDATAKAANDAILALLTDAQKAALKDCMEKGPRGGDRGHRGQGLKDCFDKIGVTDAQLAEMKALRDAFQIEHKADMDHIRDLHKQLRDLRHSENPDAAAIEALRAEIKAAMEELKAAQEALRQATMNVLTEEQRQALKDCIDDHKGPRGRGGIMNDGRVTPELN